MHIQRVAILALVFMFFLSACVSLASDAPAGEPASPPFGDSLPTLPMSVVSTLPGAASDVYYYSTLFDATRGYVYYGTAAHPPSIVRVRASDWQVVSTLSLTSAGAVALTGGAIDESGGFAYYPVVSSADARLIKVDLSTFTVSDILVLKSGTDQARAVVIDHASGYAYVGFTGAEPIYIMQVRLSDFSVTATIQLNPGEIGLSSGFIDTVGGHAYFTSTGNLVRIRLSDFTRDGTLGLDPAAGLYNVYTNALDSTGGFAYNSMGGYPDLAEIAKTDLANLQVEDYVELPARQGNLYWSYLDLGPGVGYFSTGVEQNIVAVDLQNFTEVGEYNIPGSTGQQILSGAVDPVTGCAFLGQFAGTDGMVKLSLYGPPATPSNLQGTAMGTDSIVWTWTDTTGGVAGCRVWADPGAGPPATLQATLAAGAASWPESGLLPNTEVACQVETFNSTGVSSPTAVATAWTLAGTPRAPTIGGWTRSVLNVTVGVGDGNPAITEYAIEVVPVGGAAVWVQAGGTLASSKAWQTAAAWGTCTVSGLHKGAEYRIYVRARNVAGIETPNGPSVPASLLRPWDAHLIVY